MRPFSSSPEANEASRLEGFVQACVRRDKSRAYKVRRQDHDEPLRDLIGSKVGSVRCHTAALFGDGQGRKQDKMVVDESNREQVGDFGALSSSSWHVE